jgi:phosphatidylglycerophosphatase A
MTSVSTRHRTTWPTLRWVFSAPARILMFGFGSGLIRPGSGTWGTLLAWLLWILVAPGASDLAIGIFLLLCFMLTIVFYTVVFFITKNRCNQMIYTGN